MMYGVEREDCFVDTSEYQDAHAYRDGVGDGDLGDVGGYPSFPFHEDVPDFVND